MALGIHPFPSILLDADAIAVDVDAIALSKYGEPLLLAGWPTPPALASEAPLAATVG